MITTNVNPEVVPPCALTPTSPTSPGLPTPVLAVVMLLQLMFLAPRVHVLFLVLALLISCHVFGYDGVSALKNLAAELRKVAQNGAHATYRMVVATCTAMRNWVYPRDAYVQCVAEFDNGPEEGYEPKPKDADAEPVAFKETRIQIKAAYKFKAEKGERKYNNANRLIAEAWVRDYFASLGMRDIDVVRHMSATVELCLLPSAFAVEARNMANSAAFVSRRAAVELPR